MSLGYPPLDGDQTRKIWRMNLKRTQEAKDLDIEIDRVRILKFSKTHWETAQEKHGGTAWNGRQIRNAFQTAIALAKWESERKGTPRAVLDESHFEQVAKASREFDNYLKHTYGNATESEKAHEEGRRSDGFTLGQTKTYAPVNPPTAKYGSSKKPTSQRKSSGRDVAYEATPVKKKKKQAVKDVTDTEDDSDAPEAKDLDRESDSDDSD